VRLTVSKDFFLQFASKTWLSPFSIIRELVEDCYDEDATRVIVTLAENYAVVEDDVGMDSEALEKFLVVGSIHKQFEPYSPRFNRPRTGRYGTGRLSFLAFFKAMKVKTRKRGFSASILVDEECIAGLAEGSSQAKVLSEPTLGRDGSEIWLLNAKSSLDVKRVVKELRELPILREPFFEVWVRVGEFKPWSLEGAVKVEPPEIVGDKIPVSLEGMTGEITVASRPLSEDERGIAVLHGGHMVTRSLFGFPPSQMNRITGYVRCDWLTVRFADKAGIIEDEAYERFRNTVRRFIASEVLPKAAEAEDRLSYGEVQAFKTIDRILSAVVLEEATPRIEAAVEMPQTAAQPGQPAPQPTRQTAEQPQASTTPAATPVVPAAEPPTVQPPTQPAVRLPEPQLREQLPPLQPLQPSQPPTMQPLQPAQPKLPPRKVSLKLGYQVLPYASEEDDREYFVDGKTIFVNKKHPAYVKELSRGRDFLIRYVLRIVASVLAAEKCPQQTEALEEANKLIAEVLKRL
jgi:hypothetical protein